MTAAVPGVGADGELVVRVHGHALGGHKLLPDSVQVRAHLRAEKAAGPARHGCGCHRRIRPRPDQPVQLTTFPDLGHAPSRHKHRIVAMPAQSSERPGAGEGQAGDPQGLPFQHAIDVEQAEPPRAGRREVGEEDLGEIPLQVVGEESPRLRGRDPALPLVVQDVDALVQEPALRRDGSLRFLLVRLPGGRCPGIRRR